MPATAKSSIAFGDLFMNNITKKLKLIKEANHLRLNLSHSYSRTIYSDEDGFFVHMIEFPENIIPFESPDMYIVYEDDVVGIEHFQFDSFKRISSGSRGIIDEKEASRNMDACAKSRDITIDSLYISQTVQAEMSFDYYRSNLLSLFDSHYARIDTYKKNIMDALPNKKEPKICFYIEDSTPLGNHFITKEGPALLEPLLLKEFSERLYESPKLDYIVYSIRDDYLTKMRFFHNNEENRKLIVKFFEEGRDIFLQYGYEFSHSYYSFHDDGR